MKHGSYEDVMKAVGQAHKVEAQTNRVIALGRLRKLRKSETQSVAKYCVELDSLGVS